MNTNAVVRRTVHFPVLSFVAHLSRMTQLLPCDPVLPFIVFGGKTQSFAERTEFGADIQSVDKTCTKIIFIFFTNTGPEKSCKAGSTLSLHFC